MNNLTLVQRRILVFLVTLLLVMVNVSSLTGYSITDRVILFAFSGDETSTATLLSQSNNALLNGTSTSDHIMTTISNVPVTLAACLLIKDDNNILNEWIAYHYHLCNLRHLIVAVDPTSLTSPKDLLQQWKKYFSLDFVLWNDIDYMPQDFLQGDYSQVKQRLGNLPQKYPNRTFTTQELQHIFNHRFRQRQFYNKCLVYLDQNHQPRTTEKWIIHIDTDEYLSLNPKFLESTQPTADRTETKSLIPVAGSILQILSDHYTNNHTSPCVTIPRLLFGGIEHPNTTQTIHPFDLQRFESVRWKYHAPLVVGDLLNGHPKVLLDWQRIRIQPHHRQKLLQNIPSIHRPNQNICPKSTSFDGNILHEQGPPILAICHLLGSLERHMTRQDPRRTVETYQNKANLSHGPIRAVMDEWPQQFLHDHGLYKVTQVLGDYLMDKSNTGIIDDR